MPPFGQEVDSHLYARMLCISCSFKPPCRPYGSFAWQREKWQQNLPVSLIINDKPNSLPPDSFIQLQTPFDVGVVLQHSYRNEIALLQATFCPGSPATSAVFLAPPSAFILQEQLWCGCSRERLVECSEHLRTGTSKAQPTQTVSVWGAGYQCSQSYENICCWGETENSLGSAFAAHRARFSSRMGGCGNHHGWGRNVSEIIDVFLEREWWWRSVQMPCPLISMADSCPKRIKTIPISEYPALSEISHNCVRTQDAELFSPTLEDIPGVL